MPVSVPYGPSVVVLPGHSGEAWVTCVCTPGTLQWFTAVEKTPFSTGCNEWVSGETDGHESEVMETIDISTPVDIVHLVNMAVGHVPPDSLVLVLKRNVEGPGALGGSVRVNFDMQAARRFSPDVAEQIAQVVVRFEPCEVVFPVFSCDAIAAALGHAGEDKNSRDVDAIVHAWTEIQRELLKVGVRSIPPVWTGHNKCGWILDSEMCTPIPNVETATHLPPLSALPQARKRVSAQLESCVGDKRGDLEALISDASELCFFALSDAAPSEWDSIQVSAGAVRAIETLSDNGVGRDALITLFSARHPSFRPDVVGHLSPEEFLETILEILEGDMEQYLAGMDEIRPHMPYTYSVLMYLKLVAVHASDEYFSELLGVIAWFEWVAGHNSYAQHFARSALAVDSTNSFAGTVEAFVERGITAVWAR